MFLVILIVLVKLKPEKVLLGKFVSLLCDGQKNWCCYVYVAMSITATEYIEPAECIQGVMHLKTLL